VSFRFFSLVGILEMFDSTAGYIMYNKLFITSAARNVLSNISLNEFSVSST